MSTSVVVVNPEEPAARAADLLVDRSLTGLPVVDAEGYAVGVVSDLDLISALRHGINLNDTTVSEVMDTRPLFVVPETDLETVVDLMEQWRVRRLPVCERGRVVGVISRGDVLRALHSVRGSCAVSARSPPALKLGGQFQRGGYVPSWLRGVDVPNDVWLDHIGGFRVHHSQ